MPTKIEEVYDAIVDIMEAQLPNHFRLPNPYQISENAFLRLEKGFAVAIGAGLDTQRFVGCFITWQRSFSISLVRRVATTEHNIGIRETIEKDILVDHDLIRKAFYNDTTLSGKAVNATISEDSGVNFIDGDRGKFLAIELNLVVEYHEDPNG